MDSTLQTRLHLWRQKNFPDADAAQQFLGMVEELGELAHARLKHEQGIRDLGEIDAFEQAEQDALGDLSIYLLGYCSYRELNLAHLVDDVARKVMKRDWIKYPENGFPRPDQAGLGAEDVTLPSGQRTRLSIDPEDRDESQLLSSDEGAK